MRRCSLDDAAARVAGYGGGGGVGKLPLLSKLMGLSLAIGYPGAPGLLVLQGIVA